MKPIIFILIYSLSCLSLSAQSSEPPTQNALHVATALNHLTVLEFHEPVTMAAAGSSDFQIERRDNKVFVKPTKPGAFTDLLVWVGSRRFAYELETTSEVKNMNFAIDAAIPSPPPVSTTNADEVADMLLTRAFLGAIAIENKQRLSHDQVSVRIEQVFRTRSTTYVHYTVQNNARTSYHLDVPAVFELKPSHSPISLASFAHTQLDERGVKKLGRAELRALVIARNESEEHDLAPGSSCQGVLAIRQDLQSPALVQLVFDGDLKAAFVM
jgi:hypothetical protein